jgi:hypothetical protein
MDYNQLFLSNSTCAATTREGKTIPFFKCADTGHAGRTDATSLRSKIAVQRFLERAAAVVAAAARGQYLERPPAPLPAGYRPVMGDLFHHYEAGADTRSR